MVALNILRCNLSILDSKLFVGGHLVSRCCMTGSTARLMRVSLLPIGRERLVCDLQFAKHASHIAFDVFLQQARTEQES